MDYQDNTGKMMKRFKNVMLSLIVFAISSSAHAFMPATGMWQIDAEATGAPGRGFALDVQNETIFLSYYGYAANGSALFYVATGPIANNTFSAPLLAVSGGTALGGTYKAGTIGASPGTVALSFTSGVAGTITLPGEGAKSISKYSFGYANGTTGLLGTWLITALINGVPYSSYKTLTTISGQSSSGNGYVNTASGDFFCEYQSSGTLQGLVICADNPSNANSILYVLKIAADIASGYSQVFLSATTVSTTAYPAIGRRTQTMTGAFTGLTDGTSASTLAKDAAAGSNAISMVAPASSQPMPDVGPASADPAMMAAVLKWAAEARTQLPAK
jgi:hypothetical protein